MSKRAREILSLYSTDISHMPFDDLLPTTLVGQFLSNWVIITFLHLRQPLFSAPSPLLNQKSFIGNSPGIWESNSFAMNILPSLMIRKRRRAMPAFGLSTRSLGNPRVRPWSQEGQISLTLNYPLHILYITQSQVPIKYQIKMNSQASIPEKGKYNGRYQKACRIYN